MSPLFLYSRQDLAEAPARIATAFTADLAVETNRATMIMEGRHTFRFDTFGDESFWGDVLHLHQAIAGAKLGGVGPGVSPKTALAVGLTVDVDALPASLASALELGQVNLNDPATTLALLKLNSVVGLTGFFNGQGNLQSVGIQCALCHSTVDDSFLASPKWASTQRCVGRSLVKVGGT